LRLLVVSPQLQEDPQSLSDAVGGIELDSDGKQRCLIKALKAFSLAFSRLSCSVSFSICRISLSSCCIRCSCQLSVDKNSRHRGSDARDSPWLGEWENATGDGEVARGGEQGDQAEDQAHEGLEDPWGIEAKRGALR
jgi:hypothetical protein